MSFLEVERPRIVMFCGKGGVGKTTTASATALHFSERGLKTLLLSTDPTPSLSDILELDVREDITPVRGVEGLDAVELDYDIVVEMWKEKFGQEVFEVVSSFLPVDEEIIDYVANAPGIDQEFALSYVYDLYRGSRYEAIIWDTAPAGGTLSLIKLQEKFYRHLGEASKLYLRVRTALEILTKGRAKRDPLIIIEKWKTLAEEVLSMLKDQKTTAILVTIPESLGVSQTKRVAEELKSYGIRPSAVILNYVVDAEAALSSEFYGKRREMQMEYIREMERLYGGSMEIVTLPLLPFEVKGLEALKEVRCLLFSSSSGES
ncbi:MAG: ArsA family ATPase [Candidatus Bathyarchaeia archaeon]|nr:ArsA family ATPase [Candidatus Bathyarchaeota archaeon]